MTNKPISISPSSTFPTYVAIFQFLLHIVFILRNWFDMQELVRHTISFNSRHSTDKQVDFTEVSTVSFTCSFPHILRRYTDLVCQYNLSFTPNAIWCVSYKSLSHYLYTDLRYGSYRLPKLELGLTLSVTGWQGMLTPPMLLIQPLLFPGSV
jgi:hypothetical protein